MNELIPFELDGKSLRAHNDGWRCWFVAADVCAHLGVANSRDALSRLDDDEKGVVSTDTLGGEQQVAAVNEPGLYSLVLSSRKPEAKRFKRWITHEVLPALRKTGKYAIKRGGGRPRKNANGKLCVSTGFKLSEKHLQALADASRFLGKNKTALLECLIETLPAKCLDEIRRQRAELEAKEKELLALTAPQLPTPKAEVS